MLCYRSMGDMDSLFAMLFEMPRSYRFVAPAVGPDTGDGRSGKSSMRGLAPWLRLQAPGVRLTHTYMLRSPASAVVRLKPKGSAHHQSLAKAWPTEASAWGRHSHAQEKTPFLTPLQSSNKTSSGMLSTSCLPSPHSCCRCSECFATGGTGSGAKALFRVHAHSSTFDDC